MKGGRTQHGFPVPGKNFADLGQSFQTFLEVTGQVLFAVHFHAHHDQQVTGPGVVYGRIAGRKIDRDFIGGPGPLESQPRCLGLTAVGQLQGSLAMHVGLQLLSLVKPGSRLF